MSYTLKDRQDIAQDGGAGPDDSPATPEQSISDTFMKLAGIEVHVEIKSGFVRVLDVDGEQTLLTFAQAYATPEAVFLAAKTWRAAHAAGRIDGRVEVQGEMRRALGL